jgi:colanic acid/amylovoran biosynthesis protein
MIVWVKGVQVINKGAELMLLAVLAELHARRPDIRVALRASRWLPRDEIARFQALELLPLRFRALDLTSLAGRLPSPLRRGLGRSGFVTEPDCAAILDASGYAYGGGWNAWGMRYATAELQRLGRSGRRYVFLPQSFGPFAPGDATRRFAAALPHAALICARDPGSRANLEALMDGKAAPIAAYPDFTLRLAGDAAAAQRFALAPGTVLFVPNVQMTGEMNRDASSRRDYFGVMVALGRRARALGHPVRVLNHAGSQDAGLAARLSAALEAGTVLEDPDPRVLKGLIGAAVLVVSSRFHGCVSALSQAVPCLATGWSHKYQALFDDFGLPEGLLQPVDPDTAVLRLESMLAQREAIVLALRARLPGLQTRVAHMWDRVFSALPCATA